MRGGERVPPAAAGFAVAGKIENTEFSTSTATGAEGSCKGEGVAVVDFNGVQCEAWVGGMGFTQRRELRRDEVAGERGTWS